MTSKQTFLVLGASGGTGKHFVDKVLAEGHRVRALVRDPSKLSQGQHADLEVVQGSITEDVDTASLVQGVDYVVAMLGDRETQQRRMIVTPFMQRLVPSMRQHGVKRLMYQAGGFSRPYGGSLSPILWVLRYTIARGFDGQHRDNEATMAYLATEANDLEWIVHRAGIGSDGPSKGELERSSVSPSIATHIDCAHYTYKTILDPSAIRTCDFSHYK